MQTVVKLDKYLFELINNRWHNDFFDMLMPFVRNSQTWIPLYLFLLVFVILNFEKNKWWWLLFAACIPILTDFISSDLIKNNIPRLRPCNDPGMTDTFRFLLNYRPQSSSFTSSHAANHFALGAFFYFTFKNKIGKWGHLFFAWATLICYAQIYVGVHFPLDVICGALVGFTIGYFSSSLFNQKFSLS